MSQMKPRKQTSQIKRRQPQARSATPRKRRKRTKTKAKIKSKSKSKSEIKSETKAKTDNESEIITNENRTNSTSAQLARLITCRMRNTSLCSRTSRSSRTDSRASSKSGSRWLRSAIGASIESSTSPSRTIIANDGISTNARSKSSLR